MSDALFMREIAVLRARRARLVRLDVRMEHQRNETVRVDVDHELVDWSTAMCSYIHGALTVDGHVRVPVFGSSHRYVARDNPIPVDKTTEVVRDKVKVGNAVVAQWQTSQ